ncbi:MAG: nitroreductase family protein [Candidatus Thermoplasmatota archaeon]
MRKKSISIIVCMLFIIAALIPVSGKLTIEAPDDEYHQSTTIQGWITLPEPIPVDMILEESICRRMSFHNGYPATPVTDEDLSTVLWAAYGVTPNGGRTVYSPNGSYSTTIYVIRSEATYVYVPANHSLFLWKTGNYLSLGQNTGAPIKIGLVWNMSIAGDEKAGMAEIGMIAQNIYFDANALDLATLTTGLNVNDLYQLDLPSNEKPEIIMHLGHPPTPYSFTYNPLPQSNLPRVVNNTLSLAEAVNTRQIATEWNNSKLTLLEHSQILWASYGTSYLYDHINNKRHRTVPSAIAIYPFKIYMVNETGVYSYTPTTHSLSLLVSGDKRELIQDAVDPGNISVASAPLIIIPFWDKNLGGQSMIGWWYYESGAIVHNILLEATALNLGGNVLSVITDQNGLRAALGLSAQTNLVCLHVTLVGHTGGGTQNNPPTDPILTGPSTGQRGIPYNYTIVSTDPDGDDLSYFVDWDDGTNSGWVGPSTSGTMMTLNHTWSQPGTYTIRGKARDTQSLENKWTSLEMTIEGPRLELNIKGGLGVKATIDNTGTADATNITWEITFEGGFIIPHKKTGTIDEIPVGKQSTIRPFVLGIGNTTITMSLKTDDGVSAEKKVHAFFLMFLVIGVK